MSIQTSNADFRRTIKIASQVVDKGAKIPVLQSVRCRANGKFEATGTDLDMQVSASVPISHGPEVAFCLSSPARVIEAVKNGGDDIAISLGDKQVEVAAGELVLSVDKFEADDFPAIDGDRPLDAYFTATMSAAMIASINRISSAISTEETRYYLNGVNVRALSGGIYRFAATDGHRLSFVDIALPDASGDIGDIIIPRKVIRVLSQLGLKAKGDIKFALGTVPPANREEGTAPSRAGAPRLSLAFEADGATVEIRAKLIDGTYPDYTRVLPMANDKPVLFNVTDLRRALLGVSIKTKEVRAVKLAFTKASVTLSAKYLGLGIGAVSAISCTHSMPGFEISFNGRYLLDMLDSVTGDEVVITMADTYAPALVRDPADTEWTGVIMPMRV